MGYEYEDAYPDWEVPNIENVEGACPPITLRYRIYPTADFNALFTDPPASVTT